MGIDQLPSSLDTACWIFDIRLWGGGSPVHPRLLCAVGKREGGKDFLTISQSGSCGDHRTSPVIHRRSRDHARYRAQGTRGPSAIFNPTAVKAYQAAPTPSSLPDSTPPEASPTRNAIPRSTTPTFSEIEPLHGVRLSFPSPSPSAHPATTYPAWGDLPHPPAQTQLPQDPWTALLPHAEVFALWGLKEARSVGWAVGGRGRGGEGGRGHWWSGLEHGLAWRSCQQIGLHLPDQVGRVRASGPRRVRRLVVAGFRRESA